MFLVLCFGKACATCFVKTCPGDFELYRSYLVRGNVRAVFSLVLAWRLLLNYVQITQPLSKIWFTLAPLPPDIPSVTHSYTSLTYPRGF
jgi:hypothetical protein